MFKKKNKEKEIIVTSSEDITLTKDKFNFVHNKNDIINDAKFETKRTSYLKDCFKRFCKNKASVVAGIIILLIALYGIIVPFVSPFLHVDSETYGGDGARFSLVLPRNKLFDNTGFWDGTNVITVNDSLYYSYKYYDTGRKPIKEDLGIIEDKNSAAGLGVQDLHKIRFDSYAIGSVLVNMDKAQFDELNEYQKEKDIEIIKPIVKNSVNGWIEDYRVILEEYKETAPSGVASTITPDLINQAVDGVRNAYTRDANYTYKLQCLVRANGTINPNVYVPHFENNSTEVTPLYDTENGEYVYASISNNDYSVRVDFYEYFQFKYGFEPIFVFGSNKHGQDLFSRLAVGCLFSLALGISVSLINFIIGLIYGSCAGYYGGRVDLVMERITDILSAIPSTIILVLCNIYLTSVPGLNNSIAIVVGLVVAFISTGWIGVASTTRMQFYRFKGQEYVLASRTLGARDSRLIFKHILPNAVGTLITGSVLMIPGVIFSESSLSYLGIIDFSTTSLSSIGQLLQEGTGELGTSGSFLLVFPCVVISLLMISFNLFGNGLRDAFNTSLRGSED